MRYLFIAAFALFSGCYRAEVVGRTQSEILAQYESDVSTVVKYGGPSQGPYTEVGGFVGNPDWSFSANWKENGNDVKVEAPASPGFYYQLNRFRGSSGEYFWILTKIRNQK